MSICHIIGNHMSRRNFFTISVNSLNMGVIWRVQKRIEPVRMIRKSCADPESFVRGVLMREEGSKYHY